MLLSQDACVGSGLWYFCTCILSIGQLGNSCVRLRCVCVGACWVMIQRSLGGGRMLTCRSVAGFQSESKSTRRLAPIRFMPAPPAFADSSITCTPCMCLRRRTPTHV